MTTLAEYSVSVIETHRFRLDGGAMFGAVPKVLWQKAIAADERNRIQLVTRLLVLRSKERCVIVDTGCGRKWSEKQLDMFAIEPLLERPLHQALPAVTDVILTHLHFDHAGGVSYFNAGQQAELSYPNATHYLQREHWEYAQQPIAREKASYLRDNIEPLRQASLVLAENNQEVLPNIRVRRFDGHTHGYQAVVLSDGTTTIAFPSDLIPTAHHLPVVWLMGYDLCAETTVKEKQAFLQRAADEEWLLVFSHDADITAATIKCEAEGKYRVKERHVLPSETS